VAWWPGADRERIDEQVPFVEQALAIRFETSVPVDDHVYEWLVLGLVRVWVSSPPATTALFQGAFGESVGDHDVGRVHPVDVLLGLARVAGRPGGDEQLGDAAVRE
jgi:hypothetical protein